MVDYTTKQSEGSNVALYLVAAAVVAILLFALFASGGETTLDPAALAVEPAVEGTAAPATDDAATTTVITE